MSRPSRFPGIGISTVPVASPPNRQRAEGAPNVLAPSNDNDPNYRKHEPKTQQAALPVHRLARCSAMITKAAAPSAGPQQGRLQGPGHLHCFTFNRIGHLTRLTAPENSRARGRGPRSSRQTRDFQGYLRRSSHLISMWPPRATSTMRPKRPIAEAIRLIGIISQLSQPVATAYQRGAGGQQPSGRRPRLSR